MHAGETMHCKPCYNIDLSNTLAFNSLRPSEAYMRR